MNENNTRIAFNLEVNRRSAIRVLERIRIMHPEHAFGLYAIGHFHYIVPTDDGVVAEKLKQDVDEIRPAAWHVEFRESPPPGAELLPAEISFGAELWGAYEPLRLVDVQRALCVAAPDLPEGELSLDNTRQVWQFASSTELSGADKDIVTAGFQKLGQPGSLEFRIIPSAQLLAVESVVNTRPSSLLRPDSFGIISSNELRSHPCRDLVQQDEAVWRDFLERRAERHLENRSEGAPAELACTWNTADSSDVRLAELLVLYDRVDCIAPPLGLAGHEGLLGRLGLDENELQLLVAEGRVRLVLPRPINQYDDRIVRIAADAKVDGVILSRALAAATLEQGQRKDPLLYGPFSIGERSMLVNSLLAAAPSDHPFRSVLLSYLKVFEDQSRVLMERGSMAYATHGIGPHIANILKSKPGFGSDLEFMTIGCELEWSIGLGATYVPTLYGNYAADNVANFIASVYGRSLRKSPDSADPAANRIHTVVNALLVPAEVPAIEIVRSLKTPTLSRFRDVARKLMSRTANLSELCDATDQVNRDIQVFEKRKERLRQWGISSLLVTAGHEAIGHGLGHAVGYAGSVLGIWAAEMILERVRERDSAAWANIEGMADTFRGLLLAPSLDAVIVRRARNELSRTTSSEEG